MCTFVRKGDYFNLAGFNEFEMDKYQKWIPYTLKPQRGGGYYMTICDVSSLWDAENYENATILDSHTWSWS